MIFERRDVSRLAYEFLSPFVLDLLETCASLISIGLDVEYFFCFCQDMNCSIFLSEFVTYIVTVTAMLITTVMVKVMLHCDRSDVCQVDRCYRSYTGGVHPAANVADQPFPLNIHTITDSTHLPKQM